MAAPTSQTNPIPPSPSEQGILKEDQKSLISLPWVQWFLSLSAKINAINVNVVGWGNVPIENGTPGTYGDATHYPVITTNINGLVTNVTLQTVSGGGGSPIYVNPQTGTSYTLVLADIPTASASRGMITMRSTSPNTVYLDKNANVAFPVGALFSIGNIGTGQTSLTALPGVVFVGPTITGTGQGSSGWVLQVATDLWLVSGGIPYHQSGGDPLWSSVTSMMNFQGTTFVDEKSGVTWSNTGGTAVALVTTVGNPFGAGKAAHFVTNAFLGMASTLISGAGDWCIEAWVYMASSSAYQTLFDNRYASAVGNGIYMSSTSGLKPAVTSNSSVLSTSTIAFSANTFTHIAIFKASGTVYTAVGGSIGASVSDTRTIGSAASTMGQSNAGQNFTGYIGGWRVTNGNSRYSTSGFTPPTAAFPNY